MKFTLTDFLLFFLLLPTYLNAGFLEKEKKAPVGLFDFGYTQKIDTKNPADVRQAWDHAHAVATLQGIVNRNSPKHILERVKARPIPFYWFRNILKHPTWYMQVVEELKKLDPTIELLDAPTFFELYRIWLIDSPEAASGEIEMKR